MRGQCLLAWDLGDPGYRRAGHGFMTRFHGRKLVTHFDHSLAFRIVLVSCLIRKAHYFDLGVLSCVFWFAATSFPGLQGMARIDLLQAVVSIDTYLPDIL